MNYENTENFNRLMNDFYSINPKSVQGTRNLSYQHYRRILYQLIYSRFEFVNIPKNWDIDYIRDVLFQEGIMSICQTELGVLALRGGYYGVNVYEKPTHMTIANPVLGTLTKMIGVDCEPLYFEFINNGYMSFEPIVKRYALLLAQIDCSLNVSLMNSRVAHMFVGSSKNDLKSIQKAYDKVSNGEPSIFMLKSDNGFDIESKPYFNNVKNSYIGNDILITKQTILNEFCTEIGIENANTQKRERLVTDEVNSNNELTYARVNMYIDSINACFERAREIFPEIGNVHVKLRESVTHEIEQAENEIVKGVE